MSEAEHFDPDGVDAGARSKRMANGGARSARRSSATVRPPADNAGMHPGDLSNASLAKSEKGRADGTDRRAGLLSASPRPMWYRPVFGSRSGRTVRRIPPSEGGIDERDRTGGDGHRRGGAAAALACRCCLASSPAMSTATLPRAVRPVRRPGDRQLRHRRRRARHPRLRHHRQADRHRRLPVRGGLDRGADRRWRASRRAALPWMLALEALLLAVFTVDHPHRPADQDARDWHGIVAGAVRRHGHGRAKRAGAPAHAGIPQTNVMTGNMTQLGIATTELMLAWRRHAREPATTSSEREFLAVRARLFVVLVGRHRLSARRRGGAVGLCKAGLAGLPLAVVHCRRALRSGRLFGERRALNDPATGRAASRKAAPLSRIVTR